MSAPRPLTRDAWDPRGTRAPTRIAHFGVGAFHRAHQAWFTARSNDAAHWGISAFTGRRAGSAAALMRQGGLYTLIERSAHDDHFSIIGSLVEVHEGADATAVMQVLARSDTAVLTTTITEAGYRIALDGTARLDDAQLRGDVVTLREALRAPRIDPPTLATVPGRILLGLEARRRANAGPMTILPCDNLPRNGWVLEHGLIEVAQMVAPSLADWIAENVHFASSCVDRITPRTTVADVATVARETPWRDEVPVVTEPYASWVIAGAFAAGRPQWESAGAQFVRDVAPYERRKLWLLNGAHSLLAELGLAAGRRTVRDAVDDPRCREWLARFWRSARRHLPTSLETDDYCAQLLERFDNARIGYELSQIATDSVVKLRTRFVPVVLSELRAGDDCEVGVEVLASWVRRMRDTGPYPDTEGDAVAAILTASGRPVADLLAYVEPELSDFSPFVARVSRRVDEPRDPSAHHTTTSTPPGA